MPMIRRAWYFLNNNANQVKIKPSKSIWLNNVLVKIFFINYCFILKIIKYRFICILNASSCQTKVAPNRSSALFTLNLCRVYFKFWCEPLILLLNRDIG